MTSKQCVTVGVSRVRDGEDEEAAVDRIATRAHELSEERFGEGVTCSFYVFFGTHLHPARHELVERLKLLNYNTVDGALDLWDSKPNPIAVVHVAEIRVH